jgi:hypothetical protein
MNRRPWILFFILVFMQVSVFNRIHWLDIFNPMVYSIILIWLPLSWNRALLMLLGFVTGWWIDSSVQSGGIHAMASVWLVYLRQYWIKFTVSPFLLQDNPDPDLREMETQSLMSYAGGLLFMHHSILYALEALRWSSLGSAMFKGGVNALIVMGLLWSLLQWTRSLNPRNLGGTRYGSS